MFVQRIGWLSLVAGGVFALSLSLASEAWAQKGGPPSTQEKDLPGIDIIIKQKPDNVMFTATTNKNGAFVFKDLAPGTYEVVSLSGFPVAAGKTVKYSLTVETGWTDPADESAVGPTRAKTVSGAESNTSELALPGDLGVGEPASDNVCGGKGNEDTKSKDYNSIKSNTSSLNNPGGGKDHPTEKFISNIKSVAFGVSPDGVAQLPEPIVLNILAVGSKLMITDKKGIKQEVVVAAPMS